MSEVLVALVPHIAARLDERNRGEIGCLEAIREEGSIVGWWQGCRICGKRLDGWAGAIGVVRCAVEVLWRLVLCLSEYL